MFSSKAFRILIWGLLDSHLAQNVGAHLKVVVKVVHLYLLTMCCLIQKDLQALGSSRLFNVYHCLKCNRVLQF